MLPALVLQPWVAAVDGSRGRTTDVHRKYFQVYPEKRGNKKKWHLFLFRKLLDQVSGVWLSPLIQPLVMYRVVLHRLRWLHQNHLTYCRIKRLLHVFMLASSFSLNGSCLSPVFVGCILKSCPWKHMLLPGIWTNSSTAVGINLSFCSLDPQCLLTKTLIYFCW